MESDSKREKAELDARSLVVVDSRHSSASDHTRARSFSCALSGSVVFTQDWMLLSLG
jgi:hypothetical protein